MADLIIIAYDNVATAQAARAKLVELQGRYLIELGDAVVAEREADGQVKLHQPVNLTAVGAASLGLPRPPLDLLKVRDKTGEARREAHRENLARLMFHDRALIDDVALEIQEHNTQHARLRSRGFASSAMLRDALAQAKAPLAGIWGERDAVAWPEVQGRLDVLRSLDPGLLETVIPQAGHWVAYEAPEAFNAALLAILAQRAA